MSDVLEDLRRAKRRERSKRGISRLCRDEDRPGFLTVPSFDEASLSAKVTSSIHGFESASGVGALPWRLVGSSYVLILARLRVQKTVEGLKIGRQVQKGHFKRLACSRG